jgi:hypothetical protein
MPALARPVRTVAISFFRVSMEDFMRFLVSARMDSTVAVMVTPSMATLHWAVIVAGTTLAWGLALGMPIGEGCYASPKPIQEDMPYAMYI